MLELLSSQLNLRAIALKYRNIFRSNALLSAIAYQYFLTFAIAPN